MNETLDYIESYFANDLNAGERQRFEQRITTDAAFAQEVAFYLQARQVLRQDLLQQKEKSWPVNVEAAAPEAAPVIQMKKPAPVRRWMVAAAAIVIVIGTYISVFSGGSGATKLAQSMANAPLSGLMGSSTDSIQAGIAAYKQKNLNKAEAYFTAYYQAHPESTKALELSGLTSLQQKEYDEAISRFRQLAGQEELEANPGLFYQAVALILRNKKGDEVEAKTLLEQVVQRDMDKSSEARQLLDKL